jgi:hypothetical protein
MKLVFNVMTEGEWFVAVLSMDNDDLLDLKKKVELVELIEDPDFVYGAFRWGDLDVHEGGWSEEFDPSEEGDVRVAWSHCIVSGSSGGSVGWEFGIKHVDGAYDVSWLSKADLHDLIENPRDIWYGPYIQDELDYLNKPEAEPKELDHGQ